MVIFFRRIAYKKWRAAAITTTARKMAVMIWNMIVKKQEYNPKKSDEYLEKIKAITTKQIEKMIEKYKIDINSLSGIYENS